MSQQSASTPNASPGDAIKTELGRRESSLPAPVAVKAGWNDLDVRAVDTVRVLAADAVQKAGSGHPGTAMSLAPLAYLLFQQVMRHDPADPDWIGSDRFVLSCGHSSLTQYIQLYFAGYGLQMEDLEALRTFGSKTPGHPELHHTRGVQVTTGPLGSGLATAVGMAFGQRRQRHLYDPRAADDAQSPFDHHIYVVASDGDMMEGVTHEASSLAGHQELGNLTLVYDQNVISIEDDTDISFSEDVAKRYEAYGWHVETVDWRKDGEGHAAYVEDVDALLAAIESGRAHPNQPTLVVVRTVIGWPAPNKQDTGSAHGSALGDDEVAATKKLLGFDPDQKFTIEPEVLEHVRKVGERGRAAHQAWNTMFEEWKNANPEQAALLERVQSQELPEDFAKALPTFEPDAKGIASRAASGEVLTALADVLPELWGGSADLASSNNTTMDGQRSFVPAAKATKKFPGDEGGRTLHFGIREFGMGCILNGIALEGLTRPYGGTFLVFSDYMRPSVRLASLMEIPVTYVWTHDSIGLGGDGPTHQPIEHIASLRAMPGLSVVRPGDANETAVAWRRILGEFNGPAALLLSRQDLPTVDRTDHASAEGVTRGAYTLIDGSAGSPQVILIGTGSEVSIALRAREALEKDGISTRVVSMPCTEWFGKEPDAYREEVLPSSVRARVSVEAGSVFGWREYVGDCGRCIGIDHFGASAEGDVLYEKFGITPDAVVQAAHESIQAAGGK